jgi:hypothetical protein
MQWARHLDVMNETMIIMQARSWIAFRAAGVQTKLLGFGWWKSVVVVL